MLLNMFRAIQENHDVSDLLEVVNFDCSIDVIVAGISLVDTHSAIDTHTAHYAPFAETRGYQSGREIMR
jgi:hypothetical protein